MANEALHLQQLARLRIAGSIIVLFQQMLLKCCFGNRFPAKIAVSF